MTEQDILENVGKGIVKISIVGGLLGNIWTQ